MKITRKQLRRMLLENINKDHADTFDSMLNQDFNGNRKIVDYYAKQLGYTGSYSDDYRMKKNPEYAEIKKLYPIMMKIIMQTSDKLVNPLSQLIGKIFDDIYHEKYLRSRQGSQHSIPVDVIKNKSDLIKILIKSGEFKRIIIGHFIDIGMTSALSLTYHDLEKVLALKGDPLDQGTSLDSENKFDMQKILDLVIDDIMAEAKDESIEFKTRDGKVGYLAMANYFDALSDFDKYPYQDGEEVLIYSPNVYTDSRMKAGGALYDKGAKDRGINRNFVDKRSAAEKVRDLKDKQRWKTNIDFLEKPDVPLTKSQQVPSQSSSRMLDYDPLTDLKSAEIDPIASKRDPEEIALDRMMKNLRSFEED